MSLLKINEEISNLYDLYDDDESRQKMLEFIQKDLPEKLQLFWERKERLENLKKLSDNFINDFLINNDTQFFYISNSEIFISYNGQEFKLINESELLHKILTEISQIKSLFPWKHKIKNSIMKLVKEHNMFDIIPESYTIQTVIHYLSPLILQTKEETKYFLTILGDNMLKKNTNTFHILNNRGKEFIKALEDNVYHYFKNLYHINSSFKFNWHEHDYKDCRIINFNKSVENSSYWRTYIKYHILDILSVAIHYSKRYGSSDDYILSKSKSNPRLQTVLFLSDKSKKDIVNDFLNEYLIKVDNNEVKMTFDELLYVWKVFLKKNKLPNILFFKELNSIVDDILTTKDGFFIGVISKELSVTQHLHQFWRENITSNDDECEVSELLDIYTEWLKDNGFKNKDLNEDNFLTLIDHFFKPELEDNKIIKNINCKLWNKLQEIKIVIKDIRVSYNFSPDMFEKGITNLYQEYCNRAKSKFEYRIVSKKYFEKYINKIIPKKFIIGRKISNDFWKSNF